MREALLHESKQKRHVLKIDSDDGGGVQLLLLLPLLLLRFSGCGCVDVFYEAKSPM